MKGQRHRRGFTLIEAVLALVLATLLFGGIALYTGTWVRQWSGIFEKGGRHDTVAIVLDRIVEDIEAAQPFLVDTPRGRETAFQAGGDSLSFLRPALGFQARAGMDRITYLNSSVAGQAAIVRSRRDHGSLEGTGEDLPLLRGGGRVRFSYGGTDAALSPTWADPLRLPAVIRIEIFGDSPRPWVETAFARPRIQMMADCGTTKRLAECVERLRAGR